MQVNLYGLDINKSVLEKKISERFTHTTLLVFNVFIYLYK